MRKNIESERKSKRAYRLRMRSCINKNTKTMTPLANLRSNANNAFLRRKNTLKMCSIKFNNYKVLFFRN